MTQLELVRPSRRRAARCAAGRRRPARSRRWPAAVADRFELGRRSRRRASTCGACATASSGTPRSAAAASALCATGSITPGFSSTVTQCDRRRCGDRCGGVASCGRRLRATTARLDHRIGQQLARQPLDLRRGRATRLEPDSRAPPRRASSSASPNSRAAAATRSAARSGCARRPDGCQSPRASRSRFILAPRSRIAASCRRRLVPRLRECSPVELLESLERVEHVLPVGGENRLPQLRVAAGDPRCVPPAAGRQGEQIGGRGRGQRRRPPDAANGSSPRAPRRARRATSSTTSAPRLCQKPLTSVTAAGASCSVGVMTTVRPSNKSARA